MRNSSSKRYSYTAQDCKNKMYQNKSFIKTVQFRTNFSHAVFENTNLNNTRFKYCSLFESKFYNCHLDNVVFKGTLLKFASFYNCIISSLSFNKARFDKGNVLLKNCIIHDQHFPESIKHKIITENCIVLETYPSEEEFSEELIDNVKALRENIYIRKSKVLHRKSNKINTIGLLYLKNVFGEKFLIENIKTINGIKNQFYTISYIEKWLTKISN